MQGLADVSGKRSATGVATDDNGMTYVRNPGQVIGILIVMSTHLVLDACIGFAPCNTHSASKYHSMVLERSAVCMSP